MQNNNVTKALILHSLRKNPKNVTELKKDLKLAFGTLSYHLKFLREKEIVKIKKDIKKRGKPTTYFLNKKKVTFVKVSSRKFHLKYPLGN